MNDPRQIIVKRSELVDLEDLFRQCGTVSRADGEDLDTYKKFKYAVGRNWDKVMSQIKSDQKKLRSIMLPDAEYDRYMQHVENLNRQFCRKDDAGAPILLDGPDGGKRYQFDSDAKKLRDAAVEEVKPAFAKAIENQNLKEEAAVQFMDDEVTIDLHEVPWAWVPERISGPYMARIVIMCRNVPEDSESLTTTPARPAMMVLGGENAVSQK